MSHKACGRRSAQTMEHNGGVGEAMAVLLRELTEALSMIIGGLGDWLRRRRGR
jgi:hypothetical protein